MLQSTFLPTDRITDICFVSQLLHSVSKLGQHYSLLQHSSNGFLTIMRDHARWSLTGNKNKRIYQISGPKSGRDRLRNLGSGRLQESF